MDLAGCGDCGFHVGASAVLGCPKRDICHCGLRDLWDVRSGINKRTLVWLSDLSQTTSFVIRSSVSDVDSSWQISPRIYTSY